MVRLDRSFKSLETRLPKLRQERLERIEPFWVDGVQPTLPVPSYRNQPRLAQHFQMEGHSLLRDFELVGDLVDRKRLVTNQPEDLSPVRFSQSLEHCICGHPAIVVDEGSLHKS